MRYKLACVSIFFLSGLSGESRTTDERKAFGGCARREWRLCPEGVAVAPGGSGGIMFRVYIKIFPYETPLYKKIGVWIHIFNINNPFYELFISIDVKKGSKY